MVATIDAPAKCELRIVIRFLQAEGRSAAEIHRRMSKVYGGNFMSDGSVRDGVENLKKGEPTSMMKVDMGASLSLSLSLQKTFWKSSTGKFSTIHRIVRT